jgi:fructose-1,6-bisphosphatase II
LAAKHVLSGDDLVTSDDIFFAATGITDGLLLRGVRYHGAGATTHSLVLRGKSHIRHLVYTDHYQEVSVVNTPAFSGPGNAKKNL